MTVIYWYSSVWRKCSWRFGMEPRTLEKCFQLLKIKGWTNCGVHVTWCSVIWLF